MRWMWIDRVVELIPRERMVAVKNISLAEDHLHQHFPGTPVMPGSLVVEGMAQTAGILVGHARDFAEKVILAKIAKVEIDRDPTPGCTIRHTAHMERMDEAGASTRGVVHCLDHADPDAGYVEIARIDLMFSHIDKNMAGAAFPEHNFVFGEGFKNLLRNSGVTVPASA